VIKRFRGNSEQAGRNFKTESDILRKLTNRRESHINIMLSLCSYRHGTPDGPEFCLIFKPATCGLTAYFKEDHDLTRNVKNRLKNILQMRDIASGLKWLSTSTRLFESTGRIQAVGYCHCDLTPDNILLTEDLNSGEGNFIFKISDFGRAIEWTISEQADTRKVRRITGKYAAPELDNEKPSLSDKIDVWSFGCILLCVLIFNYQGASRLDNFSTGLCEDNKDSFFYKNGNRVNVKSQVSTCIKNLRNDSTREPDKLVAKALLDLLELRILKTKPNMRAGINEVYETMTKAYDDKGYIIPEVQRREVDPRVGRPGRRPLETLLLLLGRRSKVPHLLRRGSENIVADILHDSGHLVQPSGILVGEEPFAVGICAAQH
jgi:serine/threonine protein kinase